MKKLNLRNRRKINLVCSPKIIILGHYSYKRLRHKSRFTNKLKTPYEEDITKRIIEYNDQKEMERNLSREYVLKLEFKNKDPNFAFNLRSKSQSALESSSVTPRSRYGQR